MNFSSSSTSKEFNGSYIKEGVLMKLFEGLHKEELKG